jgi:uncharacterized membrane protein (DUF4010 family)
MTFPVGILVAALGAMAVGIEREWSGHTVGPAARFGGIRTFTLLGICAGTAGWLWTQSLQPLATALVAAAGALVVVAYAAASRRDVDGTTEVSALVVLGAGVLAGLGQFTLASAMFAVTALILIEKSRLHAFVARVGDNELRAAARFGVMSVVVLPLLPEGPYGPLGGIYPRDLWILVLFFSGLSFAGYLARRAVGARRGYPLAGLIGGMVSSTSVTLGYSRVSRTQASPVPLALGVVAACTMLFVRVAVGIAVLNASLFMPLLPYLVLPFLVGVAILALGVRRTRDDRPNVPGVAENPLQVAAALQMALLFQCVLFAVYATRQYFGDAGVIPSGVILGLTDMDALTISMARGAASGIPLDIAARAVALGILANTVLKAIVALVLGSPPFKRIVALSLTAMGVASGLALLWQ